MQKQETNPGLVDRPGVLLYFSGKNCKICKVLRPRLQELLAADFPGIKFRYIDVNEPAALAAEFLVFTIPTVIVFYEGKEYIRKSRPFGLKELAEAIRRP